MIRLPDTYYTQTMLDGVNPSQYVKQPPVMFVQGDDVTFNIYLSYDGQHVDTDKQTIEVFVRKNDYAVNTLWRATLGNGIFEDDKAHKPGYFRVWMPSIVSALFLPGTYQFAFRLKEKLGEGTGGVDKTVTLKEYPVEIIRGANMPNPKLAVNMEVITAYDPESGQYTLMVSGVEQTVPVGIPLNPGSDE